MLTDKDKFDQASAVVARQGIRLAEIRTNAGIVIAATSLVASFLGSKVIELEKGSHGVSDFALALLFVGLGFTVRALWPLRDATGEGIAEKVIGKVSASLVRLSRTDLVWRAGLSGDDLSLPLSQAAQKLTEYADDNQKLLDRRANMLMAAIFVLFLQGILWAVALMGT